MIPCSIRLISLAICSRGFAFVKIPFFYFLHNALFGLSPAKSDVTPKLISTTYLSNSKLITMEINQLQVKVKNGSKKNATIIINTNNIKKRLILKDEKQPLLFLLLLAKILILIINLILMFYENDSHNSNFLHFSLYLCRLANQQLVVLKVTIQGYLSQK